MSIRRTTKHRRRIAAAALAIGLVLAAAGCGDSGEEDNPAPASGTSGDSGKNTGGRGEHSGEPLGEARGDDDITLTFESAVRDEGGFVTVTGKVKNGGSALWLSPSWSGDERELAAKNAASMAGAKLVDKNDKKRYYILRDTEGRCLCTVFQGGVKSGESKTWYAQFPAPAPGTKKVDFQIADMPPATIALSEG